MSVSPRTKMRPLGPGTHQHPEHGHPEAIGFNAGRHAVTDIPVLAAAFIDHGEAAVSVSTVL